MTDDQVFQLLHMECRQVLTGKRQCQARNAEQRFHEVFPVVPGIRRTVPAAIRSGSAIPLYIAISRQAAGSPNWSFAISSSLNPDLPSGTSSSTRTDESRPPPTVSTDVSG